MGVPIVLRMFENQPHTPSPHIASLTHGLPGYFFTILIGLHPRSIISPPFHPTSVFPSVNSPSFIYLIQRPTHGAPHPPPVPYTTCALIGQAILHWGTRFCICTLIPNYLFIWQLYKAFVSSIYIAFCRHLWRPSSFGKRNPCRSWLGHPLSSTPVDIVHKP
jgi:hypothetical protein